MLDENIRPLNFLRLEAKFPKRIEPFETFSIKDHLRASAPQHIIRINDSQIRTDNGRIWMIGLTPYHMRLDAENIGLTKDDQARLGQAVVTAAREFTGLPQFQYADFKTHIDLTMPQNLFASSGSSSKGKNFFFMSIGRPSEVIRSVFETETEPFFIECNIANQLITYKAMHDVLGDDQFDKFIRSVPFPYIGRILLQPSNIVLNPISLALKTLNSTSSVVRDAENVLADVSSGDWLYIKNIATYKDRHAVGNSPGFNVFYLGRNPAGEPEFGGLYTEKKVHTLNEIIDLLVTDYNKPPIVLGPAEPTRPSALPSPEGFSPFVKNTPA